MLQTIFSILGANYLVFQYPYILDLEITKLEI